MAAARELAACTRCATPLEHGDLRCAVCALPAPPRPRTRVDSGEARAMILRCKDCHAAVSFVPEAAAPRCAFCGADMAIEQPEDPIERARLRVPFAVDRERAIAALHGWMSTRGRWAPGALAAEAAIESVAPLYWAGWVVSAKVAITWTADSDWGSGRSRWAPHSGSQTMTCDRLLISASRGLTPDETFQLATLYDLAPAVEIAAADDHADGSQTIDDAVAPGAMIEGFESQRSAARETILRSIDAVAHARVQPHVPGTRVRNLHAACLLQGLSTERVALPAWVMSYRFRDRPYRAIVHGQRATVIGRAPFDRVKLAWIVATLVVAAAIVAAAFYFLR